MKKFLGFLSKWVCLFSLLVAVSSAWAAKTMPLDWQQPELSSNVWKISKAGQPDSYLLGTMHLGRNGGRLSSQAQALLGKTDLLLTEVDMLPDESRMKAETEKLAGQMMSPKSLRSALGEKDFAALSRYFRKSEHTAVWEPLLDYMQPWAVVMLTLNLQPEEYSYQNGVDILFSQAAQKAGKPRGSLESMQESSRLFRKLPDDLALAAVKSMLKHQKAGEADTRKMHRLYAEGRFRELQGWLPKTFSQGRMKPEEEAAIRRWIEQDGIVVRNRAWLPEIKAATRRQKTLIAVGIAHLMTREGLIELLRREGYTVTPEPKLKVWK
ncbi:MULTISPECIES: TraB/GumN family protein [unclassified Neisseria]|uniref:TraB/GumN family protein n=1 Tax=unclassified Neisseria TaxID=2623750 RepID=UPI002665F83E|nr:MULTISPECIES: TraB/GumN family protein [unclassified Neisseria]MDO1510788.1 TraB/GumN family protein [Neisseria sp. MVDL19-042950]MDO1517101.1 TraB/GumN family protein [Neisseria sp. MVDL18-041461]MDO1564440.1 TraB/GumN family protein [Neisseria sp. MVDL20-010259]